ncbi:hypothetical protein [Rosenbergiella epipactidis]|uniref:hypothetical protein n=1 Tax=Rosenbergiella epipactidis TaxID=1544694 RepID=UPI001F4EB311|nr:hypothetical protein [Rosenbergiella epipactidis]
MGRSENGAISIEFSFISIIFIAFVFIIFEVCKIIYIITAIDYSLAEASRNTVYKDASKSGISYNDNFKDVFFKQSKFWDFFINPEEFVINAKFCTNIPELLANRCSTQADSKRRLALFSVTYRYRPLKIISNTQWADDLYQHLDQHLSRKITYYIESAH